jgi:DNA-binding response OmpR family regulator
MRMNDEQENALEEVPLILVIEDDVDFLSFMVSELEESYRVISATQGRDGLRMAQECFPDLVITDLMMPIMGGEELCHELKTGTETSHIPVIMLTAKSSVESQIQGLETGADDYITKPLIIELLLIRMKNLLETRKLLRERFSRDFKIPGKPNMDSSPDQAFLQKAFDVLEAHASDHEFTAEIFAHQLNISLRTLHRKLNALTDETPSKLIWNVRLKKAAALLSSSDLRITEIAHEMGFSESGHFSRQFKQFFGSSPSEYRAESSSDAP